MLVILTEQEYEKLKNAKADLSESLRVEYQRKLDESLIKFGIEMDRLVKEAMGDNREMFKNNPGVNFLCENWSKCIQSVKITPCS